MIMRSAGGVPPAVPRAPLGDAGCTEDGYGTTGVTENILEG